MNKIATGIVLYNPDLKRLEENIKAVLLQVDMIILVDNNSINIDEIEFKYSNKEKIVFIKNEQNLGIAAALNQIVKYCERQKYEWVITLDQDSVLPANAVESFLKYTQLTNVGILTLRIVDRNYLDRTKLNSEYEYVDKCITSGSCIKIDICKEIGYFDEKMFIDLVDFEYCIRVRKAKYDILRVNNMSLLHQLGDLKVYSILGKKIKITNHSAIRNYYYTRNYIYHFKKHKDYLNQNEKYYRIPIKIIKIIFFESKKKEKLRAVVKGVKDGIQM